MLPNSETAILIRKGNTELSLLVGFLLFILDNFSKPGHSMWGLDSFHSHMFVLRRIEIRNLLSPPKILVRILKVLVRRKLEPDFILPFLSSGQTSFLDLIAHLAPPNSHFFSISLFVFFIAIYCKLKLACFCVCLLLSDFY